MLTLERLQKFAPNGRPDILAALVSGAPKIQQAGVRTPLRLQHFLTQTSVETGGFRTLEEDLNYSVGRLMQVWPKRFPTIATAQPFARNPRALANRVYGGRLGNTQPDDGWLYRGGGYIQTTGRANYTSAGYADNPEALRQPVAGLEAALHFWQGNGLNLIADRDDVVIVRKRVNGGTHGLEEAQAALVRAKRIFV